MILAGLSRSISVVRPNVSQLLFASQPVIVRHVSMMPLLDRFKLKLNMSRSSKVKVGASGVMLYEEIADKIDYPSFFNQFALPNTYNSWFLVTELHVWMVLARVMAIEEKGRTLRSCILETMWEDSRTRAKQLQADNPGAVRKQLHILAQQFQVALITYDDGLMHDDISLATSLWVRLFDKKCEDYQHLEALVKYVRRQVQILDNIDEEQLLNKPKIPWDKITDYNTPNTTKKS